MDPYPEHGRLGWCPWSVATRTRAKSIGDAGTTPAVPLYSNSSDSSDV